MLVRRARLRSRLAHIKVATCDGEQKRFPFVGARTRDHVTRDQAYLKYKERWNLFVSRISQPPACSNSKRQRLQKEPASCSHLSTGRLSVVAEVIR